MRVLNLIEEGRWGGPQKRIALVSDALKDSGVETTVLLPLRESERFQVVLNKVAVCSKAIPLHRLGQGWRTLLVYSLTFPIDIYRIWRELRAGGYSLLHVSGGAWQFKGPIAGWLAGVPVVWHLNDTQMPRVLVTLFRRLGRLADGFFLAARRVKSYYIDGTSLETIPAYSMPAPVITGDYAREDTQPDESIWEKTFPRIVTVSNVNPIKGLGTLIESGSILKDRLDNFSISIVGSIFSTQAAYYSELNRLVAEHDLSSKVFFAGERQDVRGALRAADIYVCSSVAEASPMAVWEAMSMGCAIVSTDVGDVSEYITDGINGFIVPVGDAKAMADAICVLAEDESLRHEFGKKAREVAVRELDLAVIAKKTADAYREIVKGKNR